MTSERSSLRVGGVPEHFNLPWLLAIEEGAFASLGVDVEWIDFPGGTGAIMKALEAGEIDIATPLTEGAITAIAKGNPSRLVREWVSSPLLWGIHVAHGSAAETVAEIEGQRFAISRPGSGSELMSWVLAAEHGWPLTDDHFVVVGGLDGALAALPAGDAEIFLWNKSMTQPHVDDGTFRRVGILPTPWPSFVTAASTACLETHRDAVFAIADVVATRAHTLKADTAAVETVMSRYGLAAEDVTDWLAQVQWAPSGEPINAAMVAEVAERMHELGRVEETLPVDALLA